MRIIRSIIYVIYNIPIAPRAITFNFNNWLTYRRTMDLNYCTRSHYASRSSLDTPNATAPSCGQRPAHSVGDPVCIRKFRLSCPPRRTCERLNFLPGNLFLAAPPMDPSIITIGNGVDDAYRSSPSAGSVFSLGSINLRVGVSRGVWNLYSTLSSG